MKSKKNKRTPGQELNLKILRSRLVKKLRDTGVKGKNKGSLTQAFSPGKSMFISSLGIRGFDELCMVICSSENNRPITGWLPETVAQDRADEHEAQHPNHTTFLKKRH